MTSLFSKRHYEAIGAVLREAKAKAYEGRGVEVWEKIRNDLADLFEADNPRDGKGRGFRRDKWEEACER